MRRIAVSVTLLATISGCDAAGTARVDRYDDVRITPHDLTTNVGSDGFAPALGGGVGVEVVVPDHFPDFETAELPMWRGNLRLVTWPSVRSVAGSWRVEQEANPPYGHGPFVFRFEAEGPLSEGWYAIQINFSGIGTPRGAQQGGLVEIDGWTTSRFRVGSQPIVRLWGSLSPAGSGALSFYPTEGIPVDEERSFIEDLSVTVDGVAHRCWSGDPGSDSFGPGRPFEGIDVQCDVAPLGSLVEATLRREFSSSTFMDLRGSAPPHWVFRAGDAADGDGQPADVIYESHAEAP
jgi:hypothetical protein